MSEDKTIDTMSTEELNTALKSDIDQLDGKSVDQTSPDPELVKTVDELVTTDDKTGDDGKTDEENPYRKRIDRLLRKRDDQAKALEEKEAEIARLKSELEAKKSTDDGDDIDDEDGDKKPTELADTITKVLDERDKKNQILTQRQKTSQEELDNLVKKIPNASERKNEILELAEKHPDLTFEAIDRLLAPEDHIDPIQLNRKNAQRMDTSARSRADLESEVDPKKLSTADQEKYLRDELAKGNLTI